MANTPTTPKKEENRTGGQHIDKARDSGSQALDKGREAASSVGEALGHAASAASSTVGNVASSVGSTVTGAASAAGQKAEDLTSSAGGSIRNLGQTLRQKGPQEGVLGSATQAVAGTVEAGGRYIEEAGLSGMMDDLGEVIRRNPFPAVLVGLGIGVLIGRALRS